MGPLYTYIYIYIVDTADKFIGGVVDTAEQFFGGVVDIGDKFYVFLLFLTPLTNLSPVIIVSDFL